MDYIAYTLCMGGLIRPIRIRAVLYGVARVEAYESFQQVDSAVGSGRAFLPWRVELDWIGLDWIEWDVNGFQRRSIDDR